MITVSLWFLACVFFALAVVLPFTSVSSGRFNLVAAGLFCAALSHVIGGVVLR